MTKQTAMEQGGRINSQIMKTLFRRALPGVSLRELNSLAERLISQAGATASFKGYDGFPDAICVNLNNSLIHGIPTDHKLRAGDVLTIDQGIFYQNYHTDHAFTALIAPTDSNQFEEVSRFLRAGEEALEKAIRQAVAGNRVGDISSAIQETIETAGFFPVREYVGHGVGERLHLDPQIPCLGKPRTGALLSDGQTLAIEVMYSDKKSRLTTEADGWTITAKNANLSALFERTIMVRRRSPLILT